MVRSKFLSIFALGALLAIIAHEVPRVAADDSMKQMMGWANKMKGKDSGTGGGGGGGGGAGGMLGDVMKLMGGKEGGDMIKMLLKGASGDGKSGGGGGLIETLMKSFMGGGGGGKEGGGLGGIMKMFQGDEGKKMMDMGMKMMQGDGGRKLMEQGMKLLQDPNVMKMVQGFIGNKSAK